MAKFRIFIPNKEGFYETEIIINAEKLAIDSATKKVVLIDGGNIVSVIPQGALVCEDHSRDDIQIEPKGNELMVINHRITEFKKQFNQAYEEIAQTSDNVSKVVQELQNRVDLIDVEKESRKSSAEMNNRLMKEIIALKSEIETMQKQMCIDSEKVEHLSNLALNPKPPIHEENKLPATNLFKVGDKIQIITDRISKDIPVLKSGWTGRVEDISLAIHNLVGCHFTLNSGITVMIFLPYWEIQKVN